MHERKTVLNRTIDVESKAKLYREKLKTGFPLKNFYEEGNGIKAILKHVGRLTDFKGVFVIIDRKNKPIVIGESEHVLIEIQKLVRCKRVKDKVLLEKLAIRFGFKTALAGQEYIKSMRVNWIEVVNEVERIALKHALESTSFLIA